jgi:hypothetical protein
MPLHGSAFKLATLVAAGGLSLSSFASAQIISAHIEGASVDKWIYPFASGGGGGSTRLVMNTFGAIGDAGAFDDRDAQSFVAFDTGGMIPGGLGQLSYLVTSVRLTLSMSFNAADAVLWDGTYDGIDTYGAGGEPINGDDPGRPIELYGAAYRNGLSSLAVAEDTSFTPPGDPTAEGVRSIFSSDYEGGVARDVSNNIRDGFNPQPFAIAQVEPANLNGDGTITGDADLIFDLNLMDPDVLAYVQNALDTGRLSLLASSFHSAAQGGDVTYPVLSQTESDPGFGVAPRLEIELSVVPEPSTALLVVLGLAGLAGSRKRQRRDATYELS